MLDMRSLPTRSSRAPTKLSCFIFPCEGQQMQCAALLHSRVHDHVDRGACQYSDSFRELTTYPAVRATTRSARLTHPAGQTLQQRGEQQHDTAADGAPPE